MRHVARLILSIYSVACVAALAQDNPDADAPDSAMQRFQHFQRLREYPFGSVPKDARLKAIDQARQLRARAEARARFSPALAAAESALHWTMIGPQPVTGEYTPWGVAAGRVTSLAVDPRDPNTVYAGAAEGGVWKTIDGGQNWTPLTDNQPALSVGSMTIDPSNPNTLYVGTGEANFSADAYGGAGILKTTDQGKTWTNVVGPFAGAPIAAIGVSPADSRILLAASNGGVFRSQDAGASWIKVLAANFASSVVFDPANPQNAYAGLGYIYGGSPTGVYKSTDGGATWSSLNTALGAAVNIKDIGRVTIAIAPSSSSNLFVGIQSVNNGSKMYSAKSSDGGATWSAVSGVTYCDGNCWYNNVVQFNPLTPLFLVGGGSSLYGSFDGGATWQRVNRDVGSNDYNVHLDVHAVAFSRDGSRIYVGSDGGVWTTAALSPQGATWTPLNTTLAITQFYPGMSLHPTDPNITFAGSQDNYTIRYQGGLAWQAVACGDGMATAIDPITPSNVYVACAGVDVNKSTAGGAPGSFNEMSYGIDPKEGQFFTVLSISPSSPSQLYYGGTRHVYQTTDGALHWTAISPDLTQGNSSICAVTVAPSDSNTVYAATCGGGLWSTTNAASGTASTWTNRSAGLPNRAFSAVAVDPAHANTAYVAVSGFSSGHVFKTVDGGATWIDISGDLPDISANAIAIDPDLANTLYLATDIGVFWTTDGGLTWSPLATGLPVVAVRDVKLHRPTRILRVSTHGRSIWDLQLPLAGLSLVPRIASLVPAQIAAGSGALLLKVMGVNFTKQSQVSFVGVQLAVNFTSAGELDVTLPASALTAPGSANVIVSTAPPGGGTSNAAAFTVTAPPFLSQLANAASLQAGPVSPGEEVVLTGTNLTGGGAATDPTGSSSTLAGTTVTVTDGAGATWSASLYSAAKGSITLVIPPSVALGPGTLAIARPDSGTASIPIAIQAAAPGLFSADGTGSGYANAIPLTQAPDGSFSSQCPAAGPCLPLPVDFPNGAAQTWIQFSATGVHGSDPSTASLTIAGQTVPVASITPQAGAPGVDLVVAALPNTLFGTGISAVTLGVGSAGSNAVTLDFGVAATGVSLADVEGMVADPAGDLFLSDRATNRAYKLTPSGLIAAVAGIGRVSAGSGSLALSAGLNDPHGLALDSNGNLYVADSGNHRVRRIAPDDTVSTYASCASWCVGLAIDAANTLYIADFYAGVSKVVNGSRVQVAGGTKSGFAGDGGPAAQALLSSPYAVIVDAADNIYIADSGNSCVRVIKSAGVISTWAGGGNSPPATTPQPAASVQLLIPRAFAIDASGALYVADLLFNTILQVTPDGSLAAFAGSEAPGYGGDGGPASSALLHGPSALAADSAGNLYIADTLNGFIRKVTPDGNIATIAGTGN